VQAQDRPSDDASREGWLYRRDSTSSRWIRSLKNIILVSPKVESETDTFNIAVYQRQAELEGRTITRIRIIRLKPFGTDVNGLPNRDTMFLERMGNAMHQTTREFIIRNALFFKEGDTVHTVKLADSERYLRSFRYIDDAQISVFPRGEDEAEVMVVTRDVFPYSADIATNFVSSGHAAISNRNIIGLGVDITAGVFPEMNKEGPTGYELGANVFNIGHSRISLEMVHLDRYEHQKTGVVVDRGFYTPSVKYAGNLTRYRQRFAIGYTVSEPVGQPILVRFDYLDGWLGRSILLPRRAPDKTDRNITMAVRMQRILFLQRPENVQNDYYQLQNRTVLLGALSFSQQKHYKANMIYNYGRTEDIPYGYLFSAVGGREYNELYNRPYMGVSASAGHFISSIGYLSEAITYGTFFRNGVTEQGSLDIAVNHISRLLVTGRFKQRFFTNMQYSNLLNNKMNDYLNIDGDTGIPGFRNDSVYGQHRMNLSLEHDLFIPWNIYEFRMVWYAFANFSWLGNREKPFAEGSLYSSFGFGVRMRNNRLIINTIQLQVAFFPNIPNNSSFRYLRLTKERIPTHRNFAPKAPEVVSLY
jgi:hypothetical protein